MGVSIDDLLHPLVGAYVRSPQWLKSSVGRAYAAIPKQIRFGSHYEEFSESFAQVRAKSLEKYRLDALSCTLENCVTNVAAYKALGVSVKEIRNDPVQALSKFPLTSKASIKAATNDYVAANVPSRSRMEFSTGGSTAIPMKFYLERGVSRSKEWAAFDQINENMLGQRSAEVVLSLRGRSVQGAVTDGSRFWMFEPVKRHLILSSDHLEERYMPRYVLAMKEHQPTRIQAFASALYPLARWLEKSPEPSVSGRISSIVLTSESVYEFQLELFRKVFKCPVIRHYGHSERVIMAHTLPGDERYHFLPQYGWVELIDELGRPIKEPGRLGELVGTSFDNRVMPFVRYRTGDLAVIDESPGRFFVGAPICSSIEGRVQEFVVCKDHRLVSITTLGAAHFEDFASFEQIQYEQKAPGHLILRLQTRQESISPSTKEKIAKAVEEKTQGGCTVEVVLVPEIKRTARGKLILLIQNLPLDRYFGAALES